MSITRCNPKTVIVDPPGVCSEARKSSEQLKHSMGGTLGTESGVHVPTGQVLASAAQDLLTQCWSPRTRMSAIL